MSIRSVALFLVACAVVGCSQSGPPPQTAPPISETGSENLKNKSMTATMEDPSYNKKN